MSELELSTAAVDRISGLPDDILIHILSSVPTKQAFVTSILSKRWIHLWLYVPVLKFTETRWKDQEWLSHFVFFVLHSREAAGNHSIKTFILHSKIYSSRLHSIVFGNSSKLRTSILASTTLVVLKLHCVRFYTGAPSHLNLPSLKTLHLKDIYFDQQCDLMLFLDGCPVLEDLQLSNMSSYDFYDFESSSMPKKLKRADITACYCDFPLKSLPYLEFLRIQLSKVCFILEWNNKEHNVIHLHF
jgi:hypothetical protein